MSEHYNPTATRETEKKITTKHTNGWRYLKNRFLTLPFRTKMLVVLASLLSSMVVFTSVFLSLLFGGAFGHIPSLNELRNIRHNLASEVYSADGVLLGRYYIEHRLPAKYHEIADCVIQAAIAAEDARFYEHKGIDFRAWARVLFKTILMQEDDSGGGSTITQQLAKNLYPRKKFSFLGVAKNKAREIVIARRLEEIYSKKDILTLYLNTISFSGNVFGIKAAAQRFFDTTPAKLKPEEAATLIGMVKATTAYHPVHNPERAIKRRNAVLERIKKQKFLTPHVADSLKKLPLALKYKIRTHNDGLATYFREHLRLQLENELKNITKPDGTPYNLYKDGLKIYTTIDARLQRYAEKAVVETMRDIQNNYYKHLKKHPNAVPYGNENLFIQQMKNSNRYRQLKAKGLPPQTIEKLFHQPVQMTIYNWQTGKNLDTLMSPADSLKYYLSLFNTGFLAIDYHTGAILAWVGGINFRHFKFDHVKSKRQVGSIFKPILYAQALAAGIKPCKRFHNEHKIYEEFDGWAPRNVDEKYGGWYNMEGALKKSVNTIAVQVILKVGVGPVKEMARKMGIRSYIPHEAGIALGGVDVSLYEMVNVFATIANNGLRPELHSLLRIETADGQTIANFSPPDPATFQRVIKKEHADMMTHFLKRVVDGGGTASRLRNKYEVKGDIAAKTGTSNDNIDGWFIAFTPHLAFGAWVGAEHPQVRFLDTHLGQGSSTALPICADFIKRVYADEHFKVWQKEKFPEIDSLVMKELDCHAKIAVSDSLKSDTLKL